MEYLEYLLKAIIIIILFLMGATFFSFLNIVIECLPKKETILYKKSKCPICGHEQKIKESFPIFGYMLSKGYCRYCYKKRPIRPILIEVLGGLALVLTAAYYWLSLEMVTIFLLISTLVVISFIDIDTKEIPPILNVIIFFIGILSIWTIGGVSFVDRIIGMFCVSVPLFIIIIFIPEGFGGGDIKLMFASGFLLGWKGNIFAFFIGLVLGGIYGIYVLAKKKKGRKDHFAFGPYLSIGILFSAFAGMGQRLMDLYFSYATTY